MMISSIFSEAHKKRRIGAYIVPRRTRIWSTVSGVGDYVVVVEAVAGAVVRVPPALMVFVAGTGMLTLIYSTIFTKVQEGGMFDD